MHHKVNVAYKEAQALSECVCECMCVCVGGCVCIELSADLSGLLTLSLYENNVECSRKSHGICTLTTASYSMMTQRLNTHS